MLGKWNPVPLKWSPVPFDPAKCWNGMGEREVQGEGEGGEEKGWEVERGEGKEGVVV